MKRNYPEVFDRLDQAFTAWDDELWKTKVVRHLRAMRKVALPQLPHQYGYPVDGREHTRAMLMRVMEEGGLERLLPANLLRHYSGTPEFSDYEREHDREMHAWEHPRHGDLEVLATWDILHFPYYLGRWNASSRRIYHLTDDLMMQLRITSLRGLTLRDIHMPHASFAIALDTPIRSTTKNVELDFFLIGKHAMDGYAYYGLPRSLATHQVVDPILREKMNDAMRKGNHDRFCNLAIKMKEGQLLHTVIEALSSNKGIGFGDEEMDTDLEILCQQITEEVRGFDDHLFDWYPDFFRMFIGLCVYLKSFETRKGLIERVDHPGMAKKLTRFGRALHAESEVCRVQNFMHMTPDEREIIRQYLAGGGRWEVCAHFRRGYWRRRNGEGHNPNAEKSIRVAPTLVREDRRPEGALVLGSAQAYT